MEGMCARCARLTLSGKIAIRSPAAAGTRSLSTSSVALQNGDAGDSGVAGAGRSMGAALKRGAAPSSQPTEQPASRPPPRVLIRKQLVNGPSSPASRPQSDASSTQQQRPVLRRTNAPPGGQLLRRSTPQQAGAGPVLRRTGPHLSGQVLQRTGQPLRRPGAAAAAAGGQRKGARRPKGDKRRRKARTDDEDYEDEGALNAQADEFVNKYVNPPMNPTEPLPYNPQNLTLNDFRADWPNTAMSAAGMTESVVQKIEVLANRLPHGYQSPEQLAEHYLKGKLTRFESEEEKQLVLKIASEMSAKTKQESAEGTLHKHETPRFQIVEDPAFTSIGSKADDKSQLVHTGVKGEYGQQVKQRYPFLQNAARMLNNNETYGPASSQKLLDRIQALIPQGRQAGAQQAKKA